MRTTPRLLLVLAAPLLTAAPASAWHCHRGGMMTMPVMPMPLMGMGMMPTMPMTGVGMMPMTGLGVMPTMTGGGMSMSLAMSGDPTMLLLMPGLIRQFLGQFLGASGTAGLTDREIQLLATAVARGNPMTARDVQELLEVLRGIRQGLRQPGQRGGPGGQLTPQGNPRPEEQELEQARAAVRRLVAEGAARRPAAPRDLAQARAEVRKLVAAGAARPATQGAASELEQARAAVRQLVAEGAARQTGRARAAGVDVAGGAK